MPRPYRLTRKITPDRLAALAVGLAPLLYFLPATAGRLVLCPDEGVIFNVPLRAAAARIVLGGSAPLWNPYVFGGMPLLAAAQGGVLFPLNWFFLVFSAPTSANLMTLTAYAAAGVGAYLYARRAGADLAGAVVTGLAFQWGGFMVAQIGHTNIIQTAALLPWLLWAVDGYAEGGGRRTGLALAALVALQTFAGHQQTLAYALLLAFVYALVMSRGAARAAAVRRRYVASLALVAAGLLLAAVQILPTLELMRNSVRTEATYEFFTSFSLPPRFTLMFLAPYLWGGGDDNLFRAPYVGQAFYGEYVGYVGLAALMLALAAPLLRRDARTVFWAVAGLVALALAAGRFWPFDLYKLVYQIPVLNLFRVPARHLMEVDLALAVLAGRAVTFMREDGGARRTSRVALGVGACVFALTCLAVTAWRPAEFRLGRNAPVSVLRAPELFIPIVLAALGAWAVWRFARAGEKGRRLGFVFLLVVVTFDLSLWGQFSGWRRGPTLDHPLWHELSVVRTLREREGEDPAPYRILTEVRPFAPNTEQGAAARFRLDEYMLSVQPNTYMMHGVENAAGYDGFGMARYSRMAGDMKLWGELTDPERSLRGDGREFDLLNVRYLVARNPQADAPAGQPAAATSSSSSSTPLPAPESFGGFAFAAEELNAPSLDKGERLVFTVPPTPADHAALVTSLAWSADVAEGTEVGRVRLRSEGGRVFEFALLAGRHTSEWAYDRADVRARARHKRAPVATSFAVEDARGRYEGHTYVASFALPERTTVTGGEIEVATVEGAPDLQLDVKRFSLAEEGRAVPLRKEWVKSAPALSAAERRQLGGADGQEGERWRRAGGEGYLSIYENTRALPRAWLASELMVLPDERVLEVVRTGRLPDGRAWEPRRTALTSDPANFQQAGSNEAAGEARVTRHGPNRVDVSVSNESPAVLVLSENFYAGWRASVDGEGVETMRVDYNLRGVTLAPGRHVVSFVYRPKSVLLGLLVSLLTAFGLAAWSLRRPARVFGKKRRSVEAAESAP